MDASHCSMCLMPGPSGKPLLGHFLSTAFCIRLPAGLQPEDQLPTWVIVVMCLAALGAQTIFLVTIIILRRKKKQLKAAAAAAAEGGEAGLDACITASGTLPELAKNDSDELAKGDDDVDSAAGEPAETGGSVGPPPVHIAGGGPAREGPLDDSCRGQRGLPAGAGLAI